MVHERKLVITVVLGIALCAFVSAAWAGISKDQAEAVKVAAQKFRDAADQAANIASGAFAEDRARELSKLLNDFMGQLQDAIDGDKDYGYDDIRDDFKDLRDKYLEMRDQTSLIPSTKKRKKILMPTRKAFIDLRRELMKGSPPIIKAEEFPAPAANPDESDAPPGDNDG